MTPSIFNYNDEYSIHVQNHYLKWFSFIWQKVIQDSFSDRDLAARSLFVDSGFHRRHVSIYRPILVGNTCPVLQCRWVSVDSFVFGGVNGTIPKNNLQPGWVGSLLVFYASRDDSTFHALGPFIRRGISSDERFSTLLDCYRDRSQNLAERYVLSR